jgi:hypothetical protein
MSMLDAAIELALILIPIPLLLWSTRLGNEDREPLAHADLHLGWSFWRVGLFGYWLIETAVVLAFLVPFVVLSRRRHVAGKKHPRDPLRSGVHAS